MRQQPRFNSEFFEDLLTSASVTELCEIQAEAVREIAVANAPVDSGDYRDGLRVRRARRKDRVVALVVGEDWKTMLIESKTGNLSRAIKAVTR